MMIIDQHAAHERVLLEEFTKAFLDQKKSNKAHQLPEGLILRLSQLDMQIIIENHQTLKNLGFSFESFGKDAIKLTHVPLFFKDHAIEQLLHEIITNLANGVEKDVDQQSEKMLAYLACRTAIKAGDILTKNQASELINKLEKTENKHTCPHGRPTRIEIPLRTIHRSFKR